MKNSVRYGILLVLFIVIAVILYIPFSLTGYACCITILFILIGISYNNKNWWMYLLAGGFFSILLLNQLFHAGVETYTNAEHHILQVEGFRYKDSKPLLVDHANQVALWNKEAFGGRVRVGLDGQIPVLETERYFQPIYTRFSDKNPSRYFISGGTSMRDTLLNSSTFPFFKESLTLRFNNEYEYSLNYTHVSANERSDPDTARINTSVKSPEGEVESVVSRFNKIIKISIPLDAVSNDLNIGNGDFTDQWAAIEQMTLLRGVSGRNDSRYKDSGFYLGLSPYAFSQVKEIICDGVVFETKQMLGKKKYPIEPDSYYKLGAGLDATPYFKVEADANYMDVLYRTPVRKYLPILRDSVAEHKLLKVAVCSNVKMISGGKNDAALLYDLFPDQACTNHFNMLLEYIPGEINRKLECSCLSLTTKSITTPDGTDINRIVPGSRMLLYSDDGRVATKLMFEDLQATSPIQMEYCYGVVLLLIVLAALSMYFSDKYFSTKVELIITLLLLMLITVRMFLVWRMSVFPPVEEISPVEYELLRTSRSAILTTFIGILASYTVLTCMKWYQYYSYSGRIYNNSCKKFLMKLQKWFSSVTPLKFILYMIFVYLGIESIAYLRIQELERVFNVFVPVFMGFFFEWLLINQVERHEAGAPEKLDWNLVRVYNMLLAMGVTFINDAGFGIIFFLFNLVYLILVLYGVNNSRGIREKSKRFNNRLMGLLGCLFCLFLLLGPRITSLLFVNPSYFILPLVLIIGVSGIYYFKKYYVSKFFKWAAYLLLGGGVLIGIYSEHYFSEHPHIRYRSQIHVSSIADIMLDEELETRNNERLLEAAQNQWYLNYQEVKGYYNMFHHWDQPFILAPHFKKGISWSTQTTDAVFSRYIIGEHSIMAALFIIACFMFASYAVFRSHKHFKGKNILCIGIMVLFLCQTLFIWMATTNRFVFFGQDFPLLSTSSYMTLVYTLVLFVFCVGLSYTYKSEAPSYDKRLLPHRIPVRISLGLFGVLACIYFFANGYERLNPDRTDTNFNLNATIERSRQELQLVNNEMLKYQLQNRNALYKSGVLQNHDWVRKNGKNKEPIKLQTNYQEFMNSFDKDTKMEERLTLLYERDSISNFTLSLYKLFRSKLAKSNSFEDIIHLRIPTGSSVQLALNNNFYRLSSPDTEFRAWRGNIRPSTSERQLFAVDLTAFNTETGKSKNKGELTLSEVDGVVYLSSENPEIKGTFSYFCKLNEKWLPKGQTFFLVGKRSGKTPDVFVKRNSTEFRISNGNHLPLTLAAGPNDYILFNYLDKEKKNIVLNAHIKASDKNFFAVNTLVNGRSQMIYPLAEKFFYPYHLNTVITNTVVGKEDDLLNEDVDLTLSYGMTEALYSTLSNRSPIYKRTFSRNVVVADGDGRVRAMVSCKFGNGYKIIPDPNNDKQIGDLMEEYYMRNNPRAEKASIGNNNLLKMQYGPGSTLKPITFSAVSSQIPIRWTNFRMKIDPDAIEGYGKNTNNICANRYTTLRFDTNSIVPDFPSLASDEKDNMDVVEFFQRSSNYFNSMIVFLGLHDKTTLLNTFNNPNGAESLLAGYGTQGENTFPAFSLGDKTYVFKKWLKDENRSYIDGGVLKDSYQNNFHLWDESASRLSSYELSLSTDIFDDSTRVDMKKARQIGNYAFPEVSYFANDVIPNKDDALGTLKNITLGGSAIVNVTPWKMLEMYGKLVSQNRNYKLSLNPDYQQDYKPFLFDKEDQSVYSDALFKGLYNVSEPGGTAGFSFRNVRLAEIKKAMEENAFGEKYYLYSKTGTNSSEIAGNQNQYLGVIISKNKLHNSGFKAVDYKNNKFYVMYFYTENYLHEYKVIADCIRTVMKSPEFRTYMNDKSKINYEEEH